MAKILLKVLAPPTVTADDDAAKERILKSVVDRLGQRLKLSFKNSAATVKQKRKHKKSRAAASTVDASPSTDSAAQSAAAVIPPSLTGRPYGDNANNTAVTPSSPFSDQQESLIASPPRRKSNRTAKPKFVEGSNNSPRKGSKKKRHRISGDIPADAPSRNFITPSVGNDDFATLQFGTSVRPTTDFLGWRRLLLSEIIRLNVGDSVIVVIPSDLRRDSKELKQRREAFRSRVVQKVRTVCRDEFDVVDAKELRRSAYRRLDETNGIDRNGNRYIELPGTIKHYPNRELFIGDSLPESEVKDRVKRQGGISLDFLDFPHHQATLLQWVEVSAVQVFVPHHRGDERPQVDLPFRNREVLYYPDMSERSATSVDSQADEMAEGMDDMLVLLGSELETATEQLLPKPQTLRTKEAQEAALKKIGNVKRYPVNRKCLVNPFISGRQSLKNIARDRAKAIDQEKQKIRLIYDSVRFFKKNMKNNVEELDRIIEEADGGMVRERLPWELECSSAVERFDEEKYMKGEYN